MGAESRTSVLARPEHLALRACIRETFTQDTGSDFVRSCQHTTPKKGHQSPWIWLQALGLGALEEGHGWLTKFPVGKLFSVQLRFNLIAKLIMCRSLESWVAIILNMKCK